MSTPPPTTNCGGTLLIGTMLLVFLVLSLRSEWPYNAIGTILAVIGMLVLGGALHVARRASIRRKDSSDANQDD